MWFIRTIAAIMAVSFLSGCALTEDKTGIRAQTPQAFGRPIPTWRGMWSRWIGAIIAIALICVGWGTGEAKSRLANNAVARFQFWILEGNEAGFTDPAQEIPIPDLSPAARVHLTHHDFRSLLGADEHPRLFKHERIGFAGSDDQFNGEIVGKMIGRLIGKLIHDRVIISNPSNKRGGAPVVRESEDGNVNISGRAFPSGRGTRLNSISLT